VLSINHFHWTTNLQTSVNQLDKDYLECTQSIEQWVCNSFGITTMSTKPYNRNDGCKVQIGYCSVWWYAKWIPHGL